MIKENQNKTKRAGIEYFLEDAKECLAIVENSLRNLHKRDEEPEIINEPMRILSSPIKGGAMIFGFESILKSASSLYNCFLLFRIVPLPIDKNIELQILEILNKIIELLNYVLVSLDVGLSKNNAEANQKIIEIEADLDNLNNQLDLLITSKTLASAFCSRSVP